MCVGLRNVHTYYRNFSGDLNAMNARGVQNDIALSPRDGEGAETTSEVRGLRGAGGSVMTYLASRTASIASKHVVSYQLQLQQEMKRTRAAKVKISMKSEDMVRKKRMCPLCRRGLERTEISL